MFDYVEDLEVAQLMDIREPLQNLRIILQQRFNADLSDYDFWLQVCVKPAALQLKGTIRVISSDSKFKNGNVPFTTVPFKNLADQV